MIDLIASLEVGNELGEGVIWNHQRGEFWWTDIQQSMLFSYNPTNQKLNQWKTPERLSCFSPVKGRDDLIVAFASGFAFYSPQSKKVDWIHKIEQDKASTRLNDGGVDKQGRFWAGSMNENLGANTHDGKLYCLHSNLSLSTALNGLRISNSLCWSPEGNIAYHTDTPTRIINRYSYNTETGKFGEPERLIKTPRNHYPDGSTVDAEGFIWNAQWGASRVVRYSPSGHQDLVLDIPTSQVTCVAFGGPKLNLLCVTTAHEGMKNKEPKAGNVFIYKTPFTGLIDKPFKHESL